MILSVLSYTIISITNQLELILLIKHPCHPSTTSPSSQCYTIVTIFFKILKITCVVSLATIPMCASSLSSWPSSSPTPSSSDWRERRPWHFEMIGCNFGEKGHLCTVMCYIRNFNQKIDNRYYIKMGDCTYTIRIYLHNPFWASRECLSFLNEIPFLSAISLRVSD